MKHQAFEIIGSAEPTRFLFSCEHASNYLPANINITPEDKEFLHTHWAWDIGAAHLVRELVQMGNSQAILSGFSRLLIDPNRSLDRPDLIVPSIEGHSLSFNQNISTEDQEQRLNEYYHPYHTAFDDMVAKRYQHPAPFVLISVHSFTPVWKGHLRTMDVGLLFNSYEDIILKLDQEFQQQGFFTAQNEPYSGANGFMFSVYQQGKKYGIPHLVLEFNQSLLSTPERVKQVAKRTFSALQGLHF